MGKFYGSYQPRSRFVQYTEYQRGRPFSRGHENGLYLKLNRKEMTYNPFIHNRKSIRLKGYDYSQAGLYFITICVQNRECLFGKIGNDKIKLNDAGKMIETQWLNLKNRFPNIELHEYIVMPNHFHGILEIVVLGRPLWSPQTIRTPQTIRLSQTTRVFKKKGNHKGLPLRSTFRWEKPLAI